jgi:putative transposase
MEGVVFPDGARCGRGVGALAAVQDLFNLGRHLVRAQHYWDLRVSACADWSRVVV